MAPHELRWSSADPEIATVEAGGLVQAKLSGETTISVSYGKRRARAKIKVRRVRIMPQIDTLASGDTLRLWVRGVISSKGKKRQLTAGDLKWTSLDPRVAEVDGSALVTAKGAGTARIVGEGRWGRGYFHDRGDFPQLLRFRSPPRLIPSVWVTVFASSRQRWTRTIRRFRVYDSAGRLRTRPWRPFPNKASWGPERQDWLRSPRPW